MAERPAREAPSAVAARRVAADVAVVFEFMEIANDRGAGDVSLQRSDQAGVLRVPPCSASATAMASLTRFMPMPTNASSSTGSGASE